MFSPISKEEKPAVIVHVWTSEHNLRKKGMHKGFVSLELTGNNEAYLSCVQNTEQVSDEGVA